ncbi:MAG: hypothetical protein AAB466_12000 [Verrucomicrobiota bacterium]
MKNQKRIRFLVVVPLLLTAAALVGPREGYGLVTGKTQHIFMGHPKAVHRAMNLG